MSSDLQAFHSAKQRISANKTLIYYCISINSNLFCRPQHSNPEKQVADLQFLPFPAGPTLKFHSDTIVAVTGAPISVKLAGVDVPMWTSVKVPAGAELEVGLLASEAGVRAYLAVAGGLDIPDYLGSKSTFPGGKLGGVQVRGAPGVV